MSSTSGSTGTHKINKQHESLKAETKWGKYSPEKQITTKQKIKQNVILGAENV